MTTTRFCLLCKARRRFAYDKLARHSYCRKCHGNFSSHDEPKNIDEAIASEVAKRTGK